MLSGLGKHETMQAVGKISISMFHAMQAASSKWQATVEQHLHAKATPLAPPVLGLALPLLLDKVVQGHIDAPWHLLQGGCRLRLSNVCLQDCFMVHDAPAFLRVHTSRPCR